MFIVYVLFSPSFGKTYTGFTSDLKSRLESHNHFSKKGFTVRYRPWIVVYTESFETKSMAMRREKELKTGKGRQFIKDVIQKKESTVQALPTQD